METKFYHPKRGNWKIEVSGEPKDAHIRALGVVPKDIKISVQKKESCGFKNGFESLAWLAKQLTGNAEA